MRIRSYQGSDWSQFFLATKRIMCFVAFLYSKHCQISLTSLNCSIWTTGECISAPGRQFSGYFVFTVPTFHSFVTTPAASHSQQPATAQQHRKCGQEFPRLRESKCSLGWWWWLHCQGTSCRWNLELMDWCGNATSALKLAVASRPGSVFCRFLKVNVI